MIGYYVYDRCWISVFHQIWIRNPSHPTCYTGHVHNDMYETVAWYLSRASFGCCFF